MRIAGAVRGLTTPDAAVVHPGRLARGLARLVERLGGRIVERTPVTSWTQRQHGPGGRAVLRTPTGDIHADTLVLAGEAYLTRFRSLHRQTIPVLADRADRAVDRGAVGRDRLGRPGVPGLDPPVGRLPVTHRGRPDPVRRPRRAVPLRVADPRRDDDRDPTHEMLRGMLRRWFPSLRDIGFTHAWGGPLGMPRDWHPTIAYDPRTGIAGARGYIGHGVSTANLAGRTLAELIRGDETERTTLPLVNHRSGRGSRSRSAGSACATRSGRWGGSTRGRAHPAPAVGPSLARWMARH